MLGAVAALLLAVVPSQDVLVESHDLVEVNHFYDEEGRKVFDQVIWYDWVPEASRYHVVAWRLVKTPDILPVRDPATGWYTQRWLDDPQFRHIVSRSLKESWTQFDPELVEREYLPKERRPELRTRATALKGTKE